MITGSVWIGIEGDGCINLVHFAELRPVSLDDGRAEVWAVPPEGPPTLVKTCPSRTSAVGYISTLATTANVTAAAALVADRVRPA